jgi:hypothetical protein
MKPTNINPNDRPEVVRSLLARLLCLPGIVFLVFQLDLTTILRRQNHGYQNHSYQKYPW